MRFVSNEGEAGAGLMWRASRVVPYTGCCGHESWSRPPCGHRAIFLPVKRNENETKRNESETCCAHTPVLVRFSNCANDSPIGERHYLSSS